MVIFIVLDYIFGCGKSTTMNELKDSYNYIIEKQRM